MAFLIEFIKTLLKGIVVGLGAITPGLSGSVLLVIFGLYQKALNAISTLFKNFKKNLVFLIPLALGIGSGMLIFSGIARYFLDNFEMQTRFTFLGLVVGTLPLFIREVTKEKKAEGKKFPKRYIFLILGATAAGLSLSYFGNVNFPQIESPTFLQSILLGLVVAASYIIPGVDSAVILNYFGMYNTWLNMLHLDNLKIDGFILKQALPTGIGLIIGVILISTLINFLLKRYYTITFSVIFGLFISIIPNLITASETPIALGFNNVTIVSIILMFIGFAFSFFVSDLEN
ncbi:MAG: DUF368 domain-containing protein, partial [Clostridia bacterium]|nr:DUF368 domain-containing protein [Clostridia bacterium]